MLVIMKEKLFHFLHLNISFIAIYQSINEKYVKYLRSLITIVNPSIDHQNVQ